MLHKRFSASVLVFCLSVTVLVQTAFADDDPYVYVPIAPEIAAMRSLTLSSHLIKLDDLVEVKDSKSVIFGKCIGKYLFSFVSMAASLDLGFNAVSIGGQASDVNVMVDLAHFKVYSTKSGATDVYVAVGQGVRLRQRVTEAQAKLSVGMSAINAGLSFNYSLFTAEFSTYGLLNAYPFELEADDKGIVSPGKALKALVASYNAAIGDINSSSKIQDIALGLWVPKSWVK